MGRYRFYYFDKTRRCLGFDDHSFGTHADAAVAARATLPLTVGETIEVWHDGFLLHSETKSAAAAQDTGTTPESADSQGEYQRRAAEARSLAAIETTSSGRHRLLWLAALWDKLSRMAGRHSWAPAALTAALWCALRAAPCCIESSWQCLNCLMT